ncbi:MAG TPA: endonuclease V [Candidatus Sumerlaeota bacterium]|nr:endonuclease V [Candidatus Sumerlaeota bacterium]
MKIAWRHRWNVTPAEARQLQAEARHRVIVRDDSPVLTFPRRVVALDVGYDRPTNLCFASLVEWDVPACRPLRTDTHVQPSTFPYVPGLLSFREIPALLPLLRRLRRRPDLIIGDGQGIAHPRRIGLSSHIGVMLDQPSLGWAKSRLIGTHDPLPPERGAAVALLDGDEQIGWVLRSRTACRPTYISPGHRVSLERALELARGLLGPYRLCDPARLAHQLTRELLQRVRAEGPAAYVRVKAQ